MGMEGFRMRVNTELVPSCMIYSGSGDCILQPGSRIVQLILLICTGVSGLDPGWAGLLAGPHMELPAPSWM